MFWAMMYLLFFSGSAPELTLLPDETAFRNGIADPQRLEQVLEIHREVKATEQLLTEMQNNRYTELTRLSPLYDADSKSFAALFAELDLARVKAQETLLDQRFRLKEQITEKEWRTVYRNR
jgi:hypothetical protein